MSTFDSTYQRLVGDIMERGVRDINKRTGKETAALPGVSFSHDIQKDGFPLLTLRKINPKMFIAEQVWFIAGSRKPADFLRGYTKIWDLFTNPGDVVTVAYGYRWRKHFGRDQLGLLIKLLQEDPSSRHGVVITWDPTSDGLGGIAKKNVPCPFAFTLTIIGGRLHMHNIVRSNDMVLGFPADVAGFALLQMIIAQKLGVAPGIYTHSISNAHIYDNHYEGAQELLNRANEHPPLHIKLPDNTFDRAEHKDSSVVEEILAQFKDLYHPQDKIESITPSSIAL